MRKIGIPVAMVIASLSVVGVAQAIDVTQGLDIKTVGTKGTKTKPKGIKLTTVTSTTAKDGTSDGTYATKSAVIHFDKNLKFNPKSFPVCTESVAVKAPATCPKGSQVGVGAASATVGPQHILAHPTIKAFNAVGGKLILVLTKAANEVDSGGVLTGTLKKDTGKFGSKLDVQIPQSLQTPVPGLFTTLNKFTVVIKSQKSKGKYYVSSTGCTGGKYNFGGDFAFSDGSSAKVTTTSKC